MYANDNTKFIIVGWTKGTADDYDRTDGSNHYKLNGTTVKTGYKTIGSLTNVTGSYIDTNGDNIAETVVIYTNGVAGATDAYIYYLGTYSTDGTTITYDVIKDGVVTTMTNSDITNFTSSTAAGLYKADTTAGQYVTVGTTSSDYSNGAALFVQAATEYTVTDKGGLLYVSANKADTAGGIAAADTNTFIATVGDSVPVYVVSVSAKTVTDAAKVATDLTGIAANQVALVANGAGNAIGSIILVVD